ncbi:MAG: TonB-dependent siderophore receptor [Pseudomonadota bacterium]
MRFRYSPLLTAALAFASLPALAQTVELAAAESVQLDTVEVTAYPPRPDSYHTRSSSAGTRTDTPLVDVPQSITVVTRAQVQDQSAQNIGDVIRYVPGVGMAQGEGNRETPVFRGNASTSDFFVNGLRDDVQYYRDLYNIERVEVLKGPNAMIFGRGGVGGVINRVTRVADGRTLREVSLQGGSFDNKRATFDLGQSFNSNVAGRVTALLEDSESYRDDVTLERRGINPTLRFSAGSDTSVTLGYEYFRDERIADRGGPSQNGKPFKTDESTFFGDPGNSPTDTELNTSSITVEHDFGGGLTLSNRTLYGAYDKFYQNVFASGPVAANGNVPFQAYFAQTDRKNLFNQTDLVYKLKTGVVEHTLLGGVEVGRQLTDNLRLSGQFADGADADTNPDTTLIRPVTNPNFSEPLVGFVQGGTADGNNESETKIAAVYVQDQISFGQQFDVVLGLRYDQYSTDFTNRRTGVAAADREIETEDGLVSPRVGLIYKPLEQASLYASYSLSYLPRSGEQLGSLTPTNAAFDPEEFTNYEVGAKWDLRPDLSLTIAVYQLDRSNVILPGATAGTSILGDGARTKGIELGVSGNITKAWSVSGGYAYQDAQLTASSGAAALDGATLANLPRHTISLWNRYDFSPQWGAGLGVFNRGAMFSSTSNAVKMDGYTRLDGAVFYQHSPTLRAQLNVENLSGEDYSVNAHNDNNILPGAPLNFRIGVTANF